MATLWPAEMMSGFKDLPGEPSRATKFVAAMAAIEAATQAVGYLEDGLFGFQLDEVIAAKVSAPSSRGAPRGGGEFGGRGGIVIRSELHDDQCVGCGDQLSVADYVQRASVTFARGEYAGERGVVIVAECSCGATSVVPLSVNLRPAA